MNISLEKQQKQFIDEKLSSGMYRSASEVVREALRLMKQQDILNEAKLEALRLDIQEGIESGESTPLDMEAIKREARERKA
jgi:antitoxin ParD1/3/4